MRRDLNREKEELRNTPRDQLVDRLIVSSNLNFVNNFVIVPHLTVTVIQNKRSPVVSQARISGMATKLEWQCNVFFVVPNACIEPVFFMWHCCLLPAMADSQTCPLPALSSHPVWMGHCCHLVCLLAIFNTHFWMCI